MSSRKSEDDEKCNCKKARAKQSRHASKKLPAKGKWQGSRIAQTLVHKLDESYFEPYMEPLRKEFSEPSLACDSKIELPWKEIALKPKDLKIRGDVASKSRASSLVGEKELEATDIEDKESNGAMALPWKYFVISGEVQPQTVSTLGLGQCDSKLEIPWDILALDEPVQINPVPEKESCSGEDFEMPWYDLLIPQNLVIEAKKIIEHPSNRHPPRSPTPGKRRGCPSCVRARRERK